MDAFLHKKMRKTLVKQFNHCFPKVQEFAYVQFFKEENKDKFSWYIKFK